MKRVMSSDGRVVAVDTTQGTVECQYFVNCGGFWARQIGQMSEPFVKVPLHPCEHYYLHTGPIHGLDTMTPGEYRKDIFLTVQLFNQVFNLQSIDIFISGP